MKSKPTKSSPLRWYDWIFLRTIPPIAALLVKLLLSTCRVMRVEGEEREREALARSQGRAVYTTWHQRMFFNFYHSKRRHGVVMVSQSRDGEYVTRVAHWLGFKTVRGSSTRGGFKATRELTQRVEEGWLGGMLADGPLGPARVLKLGSLVIARDARVPLLSILWGADRCWTLNTWDRYLIPKPFARVVIYYPEPIVIPPSTRGKELEGYRRLFEERLNQGTRWCDEQFGEERPWRKVKKEGIP
ncbi:MAG: lysophospholipid acyltransferase family protein, partial [Deltaproteobacteria bacterium]|nr:lysophospholipid acyltransferase family protein [Deltaproteobacteria bacterium]